MYVCVYVYVCIYIYTHSMCTYRYCKSIYICAYIYIYIEIYIYIYIYIYVYAVQRRARVHDMFDSICNGRRKVFCIECYTRRYVRASSSCQVQTLQQRDAQQFITAGGKYYA